MRTTTLSVIVRCVCILHVLHGLVPNVSAFGERILYGKVANPTDYKFMVHLQYDDFDNGWQCGGSVISNHFILTAAHCLYESECIRIEISPSSWKPDDEPIYFAHECHIHDNYDDDEFFNDIGLIRTEVDLLTNPEIIKIALPAPGTVYDLNTVVQIAGWGEMEDKKIPGQLMHATVRVSDWEECNDVYKVSENCPNKPCPLPEQAFCTMGYARDPPGVCIGDSGGPAIIENKLAGVIAAILTVKNRCLIGPPSLYMKVADYITWIGKYVDF